MFDGFIHHVLVNITDQKDSPALTQSEKDYKLVKEKYNPAYYTTHYRIISKELTPQTVLKPSSDENLHPIERYNKYKYSNGNKRHKGQRQVYSNSENISPTKTSNHGTEAVSNDWFADQTGNKDKKATKQIYKGLTSQPNAGKGITNVNNNKYNVDDDNYKHSKEPEKAHKSSSYGYVKDHHGNDYFQVIKMSIHIRVEQINGNLFTQRMSLSIFIIV